MAVKSADPVAARVAGAFRQALHTAPLCPSNVPIQSPVVPLRSMGLPSLLALTMNRPSLVTGENWRSTIGRECP